MAERKIIDMTGSAEKSKKKGLDLSKLNIDFDELMKFASSILGLITTDSKLLKNLKKDPVSTIKKILKKQDLTSNTKSAITSVLNENKKSDLSTILDKIGDITDGDTSNIFDSLKSLTADSDGLDLGDVVEGVSTLMGSKNKSKGIMSVIGKLFK